MQLNRPEFWSSLIRVLNEYVQIDNWVVLVFSHDAVRVISLPEVADSEEVDAFIHRYVKGLYLLFVVWFRASVTATRCWRSS